MESQINVGMNVDGVVAGTEKAKRKISELGGAAREAGNEAGKGIGSIGSGADASAKKIESATKNTIASIQRQTAAFEAGGTASRAYQEQLAKLRGVDVAALRPYLDQLDQAKAKQQAAAVSQASMADGFASIKVGVLAATAVLGGFAVAFKGVVDGIDKLNDMKDATGASIENLSALEDVALRTGTSFDTVGAGLLKFNGILKDSKAGSDSAAAFKALGLSVQELKALDPAEALLKTARAFATFEDNGTKARYMQELFGKSTRDQAAFLKDLAEKGALVGTVTTKAAEEAETFNKQIFAMQKNLTDLTRTLAGPLITGFNELIAKFKEGSKEGKNFFEVAFQRYTSNVKDVYASMGIGGGSKAPKFLLDYSQTETAAESARLRRGTARPSLPDLPDQTAIKAAAAEAKRLLEEQNRELKEQAKLLAELAGLNGSFADDWERLTKIYKTGKLSLDDLVKAQAALLAKQPAIKAEADAQKKAADDLAAAQKAVAKSFEDATKAALQYNVGFINSAEKIADQVLALQDEEQALQMSAALHISLAQAVQMVTIARLEEARNAELRDYNTAGAEAIQLEIDKRRELAKLMDNKEVREAAAKVAKDAAKDAAAEWKRAAEQIETSITDALMRGFESGKGFAENLRDTVVNMFKTLVLRPTIQALANPVAQGLTGTLGLAGSANAASSAGSLLSGVGGIAGAFGSGISSGLTAWGAGGSVTGLLGAGTSIFAGGIANGLGVLAGALGPIALGIGVLSSLFGGEKNKQQNTGNATSFYDPAGNLTRQDSFFGGTSANADSVINGLQDAYAKAAAALSIGTVATAFNFGSNVRKDGTDPRFALGGYAGSSSFQQVETASSDAAMQLAASRAVFAALQGSELPGYLAQVFNTIDPAASSQDQIAAALEFAGTLKLVRDALSETRTPLQILQDDLASGTAALQTSASTFKADFLRAIDGGITPEQLGKWQALGNTMDQLAAASGKADEAITAVTRSLQDIANERTTLQNQLDELTLTSEQLRAKERASIDASNVALFDQVQAQQDLKTAAAAAAEALVTAADALRNANAASLDGATAGASDAFAALQRAVAAEQASNTAAYEAQRAIATAAYTSQQATMQASIDGTRDSLNSVADSVNRIKALSSTLKSTLDGMRIAGSEGSSRASAQAEISAALARARSGGALPLDGQLNAALATVARPSEQLFASFNDYARDFYKTANDIASLSSLSDAQLGGAQAAQATLQAQLEAMEDQKQTLKDGFGDQVDALKDILTNAQKQLDAANGLNTGVLSVADALAALNQSIGTLSNVRASQGQPTTPGVAEGRRETIRAYMQSLQADQTLTDVQKANVLRVAARDNGVSEAEIAAAWGASAAVTRQFFANAGIPQFATGINRVPRDMLAFVHKDEEITPAVYNPAVGGRGSNNETAAALRALADRLDRIEANTRATAGHTAGTDRKLARVIPGNAMITELAP